MPRRTNPPTPDGPNESTPSAGRQAPPSNTTGSSRVASAAPFSGGLGLSPPGPLSVTVQAPPARIQLGGQESLGREHPIDGEGAPVADPLAQSRPDPAGQVAHDLPVLVGRVPEGGRPGVVQAGRPRTAQGDHLDRPERGHRAGAHDPVDAGRDALEEWHHPHPVAAGGQEGRRLGRVLLVADPAQAEGAAATPAAAARRPAARRSAAAR
jgi:hypothetical protein